MRNEKKPVNKAKGRPLTEEEIARRRKKRKLLQQKKKKQRQMALMLLLAVIILVGVVFGLSKCSSDRFTESDSTTLTLTSGGEVVFEEIIERDEDMAEKELRDFVQSEIDGFRSDDKNAIKIEKIKVEKDDVGINRAYLRLRYKDVATYSEFTGYDCFYGSVSEAMGKGYSFTAAFSTIDGAEVLREEAVSDTTAQVFIIQENVNVAYPGELKYLSKEGTKLESGFVSISSVDGNTDSAPLTYLIFANEEAKGE